MKTLIKGRWFRIILFASVVFAALGFLLWKPLLIAYHRNEMVTIWQTELGIAPPPGPVASVRRLLRLPSGRNPHQEAATRAFSHREALLKLGYFSRQRFVIHPVTVDTPEYQRLCDSVAEQAGQQPIAQFDYDQSVAPRRVVGLVVYATAREMPRWEQFTSNGKL